MTAPHRPGPAGAPHYLAGVDGGGTGTRVRLQDAAGRTLGQGEAGPSGLGQGVEQAWRHVQQALLAAFQAAGLAPAVPAEVALGLGLAGAGVAAQRAAFLQADPGFARCVLDNDGVTQLLGAFGGGPGIVLAAGTGSVAASRDEAGRVRQCGGWGFPVGDEGSGAWLGLRAMAHAHAVLDGRADASALSAAVFKTAGADAPALLAWCAGAGARRYAELAPWVFASADGGCRTAQALLQSAADALAAMVAALQPEGAAAPWPVVASGSIGTRLARLWPPALQAHLVPAAGDSMDGALQLLRAALAADAHPA
ncbi:BadF/BadG/BcrA/BcrD ATPase family protein [Rubrivivax rivuli]|uniref:BadF/BadG/BcrA/BcrD ATPase family protein n=1 Tax=Rubrivivax rivuli TaxID=1862385 RepID=UPI0013E2B3AE|nr:BadF/BadG/BcrA/BcrD ATPase family protein [Rubrivivax rivuli]